MRQTGSYPALAPTPAVPSTAVTPSRTASLIDVGVIGVVFAWGVLGLLSLGLTSAPGTALVALVPLGCLAAAAVLAVRAARDPRLGRASRASWWLLAGAVGLWAARDGLVVLADALTRGAPGALTTSALSLGGQLVAFAALLRLREAPRRGAEVLTLALDLATVIVGGLLVAWHNLFTDAFLSRTAADRTLVVLAHAGAVADLLLLLTAAVVWQRTTNRVRGLVLFLFSAAWAVDFVARVADVATVMSAPVDRLLAPWWLTAAAVGSATLLALAAWVQRHGHLMPAVVHRLPMPRAVVGTSLIPFAAALSGFVLLVKAASVQGVQPLGGLVLGGGVLTALAFARQAALWRATVRSRAAAALREGEARFRALVQHSSDVITIVDPDGCIRFASPAMAAVFGHDPARVQGRRLVEFVHPEDAPLVQQFLGELAALAPAGGPGRGAPRADGAAKREWRLQHASGAWLTVDNVGTNLLDEPTVQGLVLNSRDMTEQSRIKAQYIHQAFHDALTDLANRSLFLYQVGHALARASRLAQPVTVLFIDLDHFKAVNDSLGHAAGDRLLVEAARRLSACVRDSDLIARLGGDEFAVLVEDAADGDHVHGVTSRITQALARPFLLGGTEVFVGASIGIATASGRESADELVRNADVAMYVAKTRGRGRPVVFEPAMHRAALDRLVVEADLRHALERDEFVLQFQPIVDLDTGAVRGAEALVRWACRDRGTVPPGVFIPIAEQTGLIVPIGRWVLAAACQAAQRWRRRTGADIRITVNLSGRQLQEPSLLEDVRDALDGSGLPPHLLVLEITETMLMQHDDVSLERLTALTALDVTLAIDDFGTGYSSLSYLQRYPIDILKIDRAFVEAIDQGEDGPVLARAIVALGGTLRMDTVAEGIETDAQRGHLLALGCRLGQGFLFAPPLDEPEFLALCGARGIGAVHGTGRDRAPGTTAGAEASLVHAAA